MAVERKGLSVMATVGRAAVLNEAGRDVEIEEITLDDPGFGEVLVKLVASGVCHTDLHVKNMKGMGMAFPILLGHEGAGIIEAIGEGVTHLQPGDPVVIAYRAPCEQCPACLRGDPRRCWAALRPKQRIHRKRDGALLSQVLRCGTFSTHTVVHSKAAIKMPAEMPLDKACLIACGVITGVGAAFNTAPVWAGADVAVFGCGGVGISVVQGARLAHAKRIIAVDLSDTKLQWAKDFGATHTVNANKCDAVEAVREITGGLGVDFAYEAVGIPKTIEQSIASLAYAGTAVHIGLPEDEQHVNLNFGNMDTGFYWNKATLKVCHCGDALPSHDFPLLAQLYLQGQLKLDEMVTAKIALEDVNEAFHAMEEGDVLRSVIVF
jgi:S-(hydroxymethyl)mycothiol dehydrogenase